MKLVLCTVGYRSIIIFLFLKTVIVPQYFYKSYETPVFYTMPKLTYIGNSSTHDSKDNILLDF